MITLLVIPGTRKCVETIVSTSVAAGPVDWRCSTTNRMRRTTKSDHLCNFAAALYNLQLLLKSATCLHMTICRQPV